MNEWVNEWMNEWMNEWTNEWSNKQLNEWMNEWTDCMINTTETEHDGLVKIGVYWCHINYNKYSMDEVNATSCGIIIYSC